MNYYFVWNSALGYHLKAFFNTFIPITNIQSKVTVVQKMFVYQQSWQQLQSMPVK